MKFTRIALSTEGIAALIIGVLLALFASILPAKLDIIRALQYE